MAKTFIFTKIRAKTVSAIKPRTFHYVFPKFESINSLGELATDPGGGIQHFTDAISLRVAGQQVSVVQQSCHLGDSKRPDGFDSNGDIQHLRGDEVAVPRTL